MSFCQGDWSRAVDGQRGGSCGGGREGTSATYSLCSVWRLMSLRSRRAVPRLCRAWHVKELRGAELGE